MSLVLKREKEKSTSVFYPFFYLNCPDGFYYNRDRSFSSQLNPAGDELDQFISQDISQ